MQEQQQHPFIFHEGKKRSDERYESWDRMNHAWRAQNDRANYAAFRSPTISPPRSPTTTAHRASHYRSLSPASRTQAIARGQRELMEMVKNMPEACYELSLKDLVEQSHRQELQEEEEEEERNDVSSETDLLERPRRRASAERNDGVRAVARGNGGSSGRGHMLKVVFPVSLASNKKKNKKKTKLPPKTSDCEPTAGSTLRGVDGNNKNDYNTAKVSPRPSGGVDKEEWWRKRYSAAAAAEGESDGLSSSTGSGGSKSSTTSGSRSDTNNNNNNNARNRSGGGGGGGCWWFILGNKKSRDVE